MKTIAVLAACFALGGPTLALAQSGAGAIYTSKCQVCHGADGRGNTPAGQKLSTPDFHSPQVAKMSDAELFEIIKKGKGKMPAYDIKLTDGQIKEQIVYMRLLK